MLERPSDFEKNLQRYTVSIASTVLYGWRTNTPDKGYVKDLIEVCHIRYHVVQVLKRLSVDGQGFCRNNPPTGRFLSLLATFIPDHTYKYKPFQTEAAGHYGNREQIVLQANDRRQRKDR